MPMAHPLRPCPSQLRRLFHPHEYESPQSSPDRPLGSGCRQPKAGELEGTAAGLRKKFKLHMLSSFSCADFLPSSETLGLLIALNGITRSDAYTSRFLQPELGRDPVPRLRC